MSRLPFVRRVYFKAAHATAVVVWWCLFRFWTRVEIIGRDYIPKDGPFILVSNHISHFDPPLLGITVTRKVAWVTALDLFIHPAVNFILRAMEVIPVDRNQSDRKAVREVLRRLVRNQAVGLFPEGGIRSGKESVLGGQRLDESAAALAQLGKVPLLPVIIFGTDKLYALKAWFWRTTLYIRFGPQLTLDPAMATDAARADLTRQVETAWKDLARKTQSEFGLDAADFPQTAQQRWSEQQE